jgi:lipopolysaccharide export system protein LptC
MSVAAYTRFVRLGKHTLWILIAVVVAVIVWISSNSNGEDGSRLVFSNIPQGAVTENVMIKPRYQGLDEKNQPYTVVADNAVQKDADTVELKNIRADMMQNTGTWIGLNAGAGELNMKTRKMLLSGGVSLFYDGGYEMRSDHARVDIGEGHAFGDAPVEGQAPGGTITADRFEVVDNGKVIRFNGSVRMKLYPDSK